MAGSTSLRTTLPRCSNYQQCFVFSRSKCGAEPEPTCHIHTETSTYTIDIGYPLGYPDQLALTDFCDA